MNVHFVYKLPKNSELEKHINPQLEKLRKRLQVFRPDLVSLHGTVDENPKTGFHVGLNLRLPSGQMASNGDGPTEASAVKKAFEDLIEQLTKHKDQLRSRHKWPRRRFAAENPRPQPQVPFEETFAAVMPEKVNEQDITFYVDANLPRLRRWVERELRFRFNNGQIREGQLRPDEVIDEAIASALDDRTEKPEKVRLEPWLYHLAGRAINRLLQQNYGDDGSVPLESVPRRTALEAPGDDETFAQFNQPDDVMTQEGLIGDPRLATPEQNAQNDEMVAMIEMSLREAKPEDREAFILYTMEGFTTQEIAVITSRKPEDVRASIARARDHVRKAFPGSEPIKTRLIEHSKTA
jgi:RNA polymerase sigma factor (sigma-70 family)